MNKEQYSAYARIPQKTALSVYYCGKGPREGEVTEDIVRTQYVFFYVLSGSGTFRRGKEKHALTAGDGVMILPDQLTRCEANPQDPWQYLWIGFDGTEVPRLVTDLGYTAQNFIYRGESGSALENELTEMVRLFEQDKNDKLNILSHFYAAMAQLKVQPASRRQGELAYVEKALDYIHHNYIYRIRIDDISRYVGLDRTYLFKLFVRHVGTAPQEYLIGYRLKNAEGLLINTKLSASSIAYSCGFRDAPSFCKHFKARYHTSPLGFRKAQREGAED